VGQKYQQLNLDYRNKIEALIDEKKHASLAIALALADNYKIKKALMQNNHELIDLGEVSSTYKKNTDFKNVWIQIQDSKGKSFKRSWTQKRGDDLSKVRYDVKEMIANPTIKSTVSIGKFDMTFKSMVPIYSEERRFIGIFEIITHFNSIAKKIQEDGSQLVIAVDKKYKKSTQVSFYEAFCGGLLYRQFGGRCRAHRATQEKWH
jgi:sensor histidine kinase regulating citrate/malate metabolism